MSHVRCSSFPRVPITHHAPRTTRHAAPIRVPVLLVKGLTVRTTEAILHERKLAPFSSLADFFLRVQPLPEEMQALIRVGAFDSFGQPRTTQYWDFKSLCQTEAKSETRNPTRCARAPARRESETNSNKDNSNAQNTGNTYNARFANSLPASLPLPLGEGRGEGDSDRDSPGYTNDKVSNISDSNFGFVSDLVAVRKDIRTSDLVPPRPHQLLLFSPVSRSPSTPLTEPTRLDRLRAEEELLGYPVSGHPLELFPDIAWDTYCPINRLGEHLGRQIVTCGLVIEQRMFHQANGEPMKFITIADWTGIIETELFAKTYRSYGLSTIRYRVLEITATVEPFDNARGHTLRVLRAGKPRKRNEQ